MTEEQKNKCAELWSEHAPYMERYCKIKMRGYEIEIDDAMGDLHLAFCNQIVNEGFPRNPKAWLYKTIKNIVNKKFRKKYSQEKHIVDIDTEIIELKYQHDFVETVEANEQIEQIEKIIPTLKGNSQTILHKTYFDKHSMKEIAENLGSTEKAVKQKRYRICRDLKKEIE